MGAGISTCKFPFLQATPVGWGKAGRVHAHMGLEPLTECAFLAAGIPDFRSPSTGLYANLEKYHLPYPEAIFEISYFKVDC